MRAWVSRSRAKLWSLREEKNRLKRQVTDVALDRQILHEMVSKMLRIRASVPAGAVDTRDISAQSTALNSSGAGVVDDLAL
jgi:hypothetical protein